MATEDDAMDLIEWLQATGFLTNLDKEQLSLLKERLVYEIARQWRDGWINGNGAAEDKMIKYER